MLWDVLWAQHERLTKNVVVEGRRGKLLRFTCYEILDPLSFVLISFLLCRSMKMVCDC